MNDAVKHDSIAHFDEAAKTWADLPRRVVLGEKMAEAIGEAVPLHPGMRALDFGCGVGLVSLPLAPRVDAIVGADTSPGMLEKLRERLCEGGVQNVSPVLLPGEAAALEEQPFDLVFTSMTLHHVPDVDGQLADFARWCAPGGWLAIADLEPEDGTFHEAHQGLIHTGFDPADLAARLETLGFTACQWRTAHVLKRDRVGVKDKEYPMFLLTARRRAD